MFWGLARAGGKSNATEKITVGTMPFDKPAVRTFRAFVVISSAVRALQQPGRLRHCGNADAAAVACGHEIAAHEIVLATVPDLAIAGRHGEQPPAAFAAGYMLRHRSRSYGEAVLRVGDQFSHKGRRL